MTMLRVEVSREDDRYRKWMINGIKVWHPDFDKVYASKAAEVTIEDVLPGERVPRE